MSRYEIGSKHLNNFFHLNFYLQMNKLRVLVCSLVLGLPLLFNQCQPTQELQPTFKRDNSSAKRIGSSGYDLSYIGTTPSNGAFIWQYSLQRLIVGNDNLQEVYIPLSECLAGKVDPLSIKVYRVRKNGSLGTEVTGGMEKSITDDNQIAITKIAGMGVSLWYIYFTTTENAATQNGTVTVVQKESSVPTPYTDVIATPGDCTDEPPAAPCAFSQGFWFRKPDVLWGSDVLAGRHSYDKVDGVAIFNARGSKGNASLSNAFTQLAAMRLNYGDDIPADIAPAVKTLQDYLATFTDRLATNGRANATYFSKSTVVPTSVKTAIKNVGNWICTHHCDNNLADDQPACDPILLQ
jgi:hypothetical protein